MSKKKKSVTRRRFLEQVGLAGGSAGLGTGVLDVADSVLLPSKSFAGADEFVGSSFGFISDFGTRISDLFWGSGFGSGSFI